MSKTLDFYASAFSPESLYGFYHIVAIFSMLVLVWMFGLSYLVYKANADSPEIDLCPSCCFAKASKPRFWRWKFFLTRPRGRTCGTFFFH